MTDYTPFLTIFPGCEDLHAMAGGLDQAYVTDVQVNARELLLTVSAHFAAMPSPVDLSALADRLKGDYSLKSVDIIADYPKPKSTAVASFTPGTGSGGDGPFTPTRMGTMAVTDVIKFLFDKPIDEVRKLCQSTGGLSSWFGTSNSDTIHELVEKGDPKATLIWNALIYQINKLIGSMACVLHGKVDAIILTGGLMRFDDVYDGIKEACSWIAPVSSYPGELEHEAMRDGALRVLRGEEEAKTYPGKPVFSGFDFD
jgi:hypothetical protein